MRSATALASIAALALFAMGCNAGRRESACDHGDGAACVQLAEPYDPRSHPPGDLVRWQSLHKKACENGEAMSCYLVAKTLPDPDGDEALALLDRASKGGVVAACNDRALRLPDGPEKTELLRRACDGGINLGCSNLGVLLIQGRGVPKDLPAAFALFERACSKGEPAGCYNEANAYEEGIAVPLNEERALELYEKTCDLHYPAGCDGLGSMLLKRGAEDRGHLAFKRGCDLTSPGALGPSREQATVCMKLGLSYLHGMGVAPDAARAAPPFTFACDHGNADACLSLGNIEKDGGDMARAAVHLQKACDGGLGSGCNNIALMCSLGMGMAKDEPRAVALFAKACDLGEMLACANLGSRYLGSEGVARDEPKGRALLKRACEGGVAVACDNGH